MKNIRPKLTKLFKKRARAHLRKPRHPPASLIERILSVMATLGLACFCIGLIVFIYGKASNNLTVDLIGGRVLVIGIVLIAPKILFWIAVKIVEQGLDSISGENSSSGQLSAFHYAFPFLRARQYATTTKRPRRNDDDTTRRIVGLGLGLKFNPTNKLTQADAGENSGNQHN